MIGLDSLDVVSVVTAFAFQVVLTIHFALRRWRFATAMRYGPLVYALSVPTTAISIVLLMGGKTWSLWLGGFLYLVWALFGFAVEYVRGIEWRSPIRWSILGPYVCLYLATVMFYWWPLALPASRCGMVTRCSSLPAQY
jgi:hypothetical protein